MDDLIFSPRDLGLDDDAQAWRERLPTPEQGAGWHVFLDPSLFLQNASNDDKADTNRDEKAIKSADPRSDG